MTLPNQKALEQIKKSIETELDPDLFAPNVVDDIEQLTKRAIAHFDNLKAIGEISEYTIEPIEDGIIVSSIPIVKSITVNLILKDSSELTYGENPFL